MNKLYTKNSRQRKINSCQEHILFILWPIVFALFVCLFWKVCYIKNIHFSKNDESALIGAAITTLGVCYSIVAALVLNETFDKYKLVVQCILKKDKETFLRYRDERMPFIIYILISSLSIPLLLMIGLLEYENFYAGLMSVFFVSFVLSLYWRVVVKLENPCTSIWLKQRIPADWMEIDIDKTFFQDIVSHYKF